MALIVGVLAAGCSGGADTSAESVPSSSASSLVSQPTALASVDDEMVEADEAAEDLETSETTTVQSDQASNDEGISYDEAKERGVLHGEFDAMVIPANAAGAGDFGFEVRNVGQSADTYTLSVDGSNGADGTVEPAVFELASGDSAVVVVKVTAGGPEDIEFVVESAGLNGNEVARQKLG